MPVSRKRRKPGAARNVANGGNGTLPPAPDPKVIESLLTKMSAVSRFAKGMEESDPVAAAQEIIYDAWEAESRMQRIALARKALKISPDCADAYVLLAQETAQDADVEVELYRKGVEAGERALGRAPFEEDVGDFWGLLETRPYMRARCGLAIALWRKGDRNAAIVHIWDMLRLNPNDNQGMRYALLALLMEQRRHDEAEALLRGYKDDDRAQWQYGRALLAFVRSGDTAASRRLLAAAIKSNRHVPTYLLGRKLPIAEPDFITMGGDDEAQTVAREALLVWRDTPRALEWLASRAAAAGRKL